MYYTPPKVITASNTKPKKKSAIKLKLIAIKGLILAVQYLDRIILVPNRVADIIEQNIILGVA